MISDMNHLQEERDPVRDEVAITVPLRENAGLASLSHWSFLMGYAVPFASLILPLVLMNTTGRTDRFVYENAKEALNFLIAFLIVMIGCIVTIVGVILVPLLLICFLVFPIIAACQTMSSTVDTPVYRYPLIFRLLK